MAFKIEGKEMYPIFVFVKCCWSIHSKVVRLNWPTFRSEILQRPEILLETGLRWEWKPLSCWSRLWHPYPWLSLVDACFFHICLHLVFSPWLRLEVKLYAGVIDFQWRLWRYPNLVFKHGFSAEILFYNFFSSKWGFVLIRFVIFGTHAFSCMTVTYHVKLIL